MATDAHVANPQSQTGVILPPPILEVRGLVVQRDTKIVLEIDSLTVHEGEVLAVIGPNGAGKSTLLSAVACLIPYSAAEVRFAGTVIAPRDDLVRLRRRMAVVFQEPLLLDTSVKDNVASGLNIRGVNGSEASRRVSEWMKRFGVVALADRPARKLSGGEAQRVSLARAFALRPELLLLDEPFSALDAPTRASLLDDFERVLRESRQSTIFVTHDRTEALRIGDRIAVVIDGRIVQIGTPEEVFSTPSDERVAAFVGVENIIPGRVTAQRDGIALVDLHGAVAEVVSDAVAGQSVLFCLRPEDVVVSAAPGGDQPTSARNRLRGRVVRHIPLGSQVRLVVNCGFQVVALITRRSFEELGFTAGSEVLVSFKASSVHLLPK